MYQLYGCRLTRSLIVQMVLAEGDIDYELRQVDIFNDEHRRPDFLALNPAGFVIEYLQKQVDGEGEN